VGGVQAAWRRSTRSARPLPPARAVPSVGRNHRYSRPRHSRRLLILLSGRHHRQSQGDARDGAQAARRQSLRSAIPLPLAWAAPSVGHKWRRRHLLLTQAVGDARDGAQAAPRQSLRSAIPLPLAWAVPSVGHKWRRHRLPLTQAVGDARDGAQTARRQLTRSAIPLPLAWAAPSVGHKWRRRRLPLAGDAQDGAQAARTRVCARLPLASDAHAADEALNVTTLCACWHGCARAPHWSVRMDYQHNGMCISEIRRFGRSDPLRMHHSGPRSNGRFQPQRIGVQL